MKRVISMIMIVALLLFGCSYHDPEQTENHSHSIYRFTFKEKLISNNNVGNDWTITYKYNGATIKSGHTITLSPEIFAFQSIEVEIREDDKHPDISAGIINAAICDGGSGKTQITVTETNGRYKGNIAVWEITCEVKLVDKKGEPSALP